MDYLRQEIIAFQYVNIPATWADYNPATTYTLEDSTSLTDDSVALYDNYYYRSLVTGNLGFTPTDPKYLGTKWMKWQVSNRYAMIDLSAQSKSIVVGGDLIVEFARGDIETLGIGNFEATDVIIEHYNSGNGVITGLTIATSLDLNSTIIKGACFVDDTRVEKTTDTAKLFTASKDTYVDITSAGAYVYTEVSNGASAPAITPPNQRLSMVETDADNITATTDLRTMLTVASQSVHYSVNEDVIDYYSYMYSEYSAEVDRGIKLDIQPIGEYIRVTFVKQPDTNRASCGYLIGGQPVDMGETLSTVNFNFNSFALKETDSFGTLNIIKRNVQDLVDFETKIPQTQTVSIKREVKKIYNDIILFIVDPSDNSIHENLLTLGVIENAQVVLTSNSKSILTWSIYEAI